jgi:hypothetical protein
MTIHSHSTGICAHARLFHSIVFRTPQQLICVYFRTLSRAARSVTLLSFLICLEREVELSFHLTD